MFSKMLRRKVKSFLRKHFGNSSKVLADAKYRVGTTDLVQKIFKFCELYSGRNLYPYQEQLAKRLIRSVLDNDGEEITALFSRQSGKSETIAVISGGLMIILPTLANLPMFAGDKRLEMYKDGFTIGVFAPSERQAKKTYGKIQNHLLSRYAETILTSPDFNLRFTTSNGQTVSLTNGSFCTAISASDGSNIEGESFMLIICEESQDISDFKITKSIHPMGAAYNATIVKIGTPTTHKGNFYDTIQRNKAKIAKTPTAIRNHFEYDYLVASKYNPNYAKYVEKEKARLGENSDSFKMSYKLQWIIERGMFIDLAKFEKNNLELSLERTFYDKTAIHVAGIDVGGKGDSTVVTICEVDWDMPVILEQTTDENGDTIIYEAYNVYLKDWLCLREIPDYEEQYPLIMDYLSNFKLARVVCDATREASFAHRLRANLSCEVIPYIFTMKSKSELYKVLDKEIGAGRARVCAGEKTQETFEYKEFLTEMADLQKGYSGANLVVSHPDVRGAHDDFCDSFALAVWGCQSRGSADVSETKNNPFMKKTSYEQKKSSIRNMLTAKRRR